jgi:hypothetical protein
MITLVVKGAFWESPERLKERLCQRRGEENVAESGETW